MWSDVWHGFNANHFDVARAHVVQRAQARGAIGRALADAEVYIVRRSARRLRNRFVFVGLQAQEKASLCMLRRVVQTFPAAHGLPDTTVGLDAVAQQKERLNSGSYELDAAALWQAMTPAERTEYKAVDHVDPQTYKHATALFRETTIKFGCQKYIETTRDDDIALD